MLPCNTVSPPDLTVRDVARLCNLSERAVRKRISSGEIPSYRIGTSVRVPTEAVERLRNGDDHPIESAIDRIVAAAPELSDEQRARISALLRVGE